MNHKQLIKRIAAQTSLPLATVSSVMSVFAKTVLDECRKGDIVKISGLGTFRPKTIAPRVGRNPKTGEKIQIPERQHLSFKRRKQLFED